MSMSANRTTFATMPDGSLVEELTLCAGPLRCSILTYGGAVRSLVVPDRDGNPVDVVLGFDSLEDYQAQTCYIGALIGRCGNRIGGAKFTLNGVEYSLFVNNSPNHLHGGAVGFDKQNWTVESLTDNQVVLSLVSPDGQENYPGTLTVTVTYTLTREGLSIAYRATTDADTLCNLTNHSYFNLSGHNSGSVAEQTISIAAQCYTPTNAGSIPTGEIASVAGTPMDLRTPVAIGAHWDDDFPQLVMAGGYDHNWVLDGQPGQLRCVATAHSPATGITMEVYTTTPGMQFYSGNFLEDCPAGKGGAHYFPRCAFALETQNFPDAPHHDNFPSAVLKPGQEYREETVYKFV